MVLATVTLVGLVAAAPGEAAQPKLSEAQQSARAWYQQVIGDLGPLDTSLVAGLQTAAQWQDGTESSSAANQAIAGDLPDLQQALRNVEAQPPLAGHAAALIDMTAGIKLYVEAFELEAAATLIPAGGLTRQLQRSFLRIRQLGDVTYDQGVAQMSPLLGSTLAGPDVRAALRIPDWTSLHLAPGSPLESSWTGTPRQPSASQSVGAWSAAVSRVGAPTQSAVQLALTTGAAMTAALSKLARALQGAEVRLASVPVPRGHAGASAALRLGLLVDAEAALAAVASHLTGPLPNPALHSVAAALAAIGGGLRSTSQVSAR